VEKRHSWRGREWRGAGQCDSVSAMMRFEQLRAWQSAHRLALAVYQVTESWPRREVYGLTSQTRRAAVSVPANIAKGTAKLGKKEVARFLETALASFTELTSLLRLSLDLGMMTSDEWQALEQIREETGKLLWGLYRYARRHAPK
jgi:four helix bundle protein